MAGPGPELKGNMSIINYATTRAILIAFSAIEPPCVYGVILASIYGHNLDRYERSDNIFWSRVQVDEG
jgi:hypothetical protein